MNETTGTTRGTPAPARADRSRIRRTLFSATIGTTIEWYDFNVYTTVAALVLPKLFFPVGNEELAILASFGTYAVGFAARPLGGILFGHIGDRLGRKAALVSTLLIIGLSTLAIGFMPTYEQSGVTGPILLIALRIVQGIGVGGEWGGSVLIAMELAPRGKRGFYASWSGFGVPLSLLIATAVVSVVSSWSGQGFVSSSYLAGWRWPFYLSVLLVGVGLYIRTRVTETDAFKQVKESGAVARQPVAEVIRKNWRDILTIIFLRAGENAPYYVLSSFVLVYTTTVLHLSRGFVLNCVLGAAAVAMIGVPLFGHVADRIGHRRAYVVGTVLQLLFAFPYFGLLGTGNRVVIAITVVLSLIPWTFQYGPQPAIVAESFPTGLRYSGASLGYQFGTPLWGGLAPLIAVALLPVSAWWIAVYIVALCLVTLVATRTIRDNSADLDRVT